MLEYLKGKIIENMLIAIVGAAIGYGIVGIYMQVNYNIIVGLVGGFIGASGIDAIAYALGLVGHDKS